MLVEDENTGHERLAPHGQESTGKKPPNMPPRMKSSKSSVHKMNQVHPIPMERSGKSFHKFGITAEEVLKIDGTLDELNKLGGVKGLAHRLRVDTGNGIEGVPEELKFRSDTFGSNTYPVKEQKHFLEFLWEACQDETLLILVVCAVVSLVVGLTTESLKTGWYDGAGIGFAVILVVMVASVSDWKQSLQFQELSAEKRKIQINVTRSGRRLKILIFDLVVGDIVHLNIGDQIPGDGVLVEGHSLVIDESSMTGESEPMSKDDEKPFLLSGCKVLDGFGTMMVTAVGMNTEWGKVMATLSEDVDESTPLQERLDSLATTIGKVGLGIAVIVFFVLLIRFLATVDLKHFTGDDGRQIVDFFAIAVTIVVVAVPEGLPLAVTLTLAYSMAKMMDDRALVRHLAACETMGSATTICSDKTGTLTMNQMTVVNNWICGKLRKTIGIEGFSDATIQLLYQSICLNTNGNVFFKANVSPEVSGTPTETAVLLWGVKLGAKFPEIRQEVTILAVETFNSTKKRMGVVFRSKDGKAWLHWKGAAEIMLEQCSRVIEEDGNILDLTKDRKEELYLIISAFANAALRTLCFAYREISDEEVQSLTPEKLKAEGLPEKDLICLSIIGIKDPCRPGVPEAVTKCQQAGIMVRMVTGDNIQTAVAIATECGIFTEGGQAIEGKDFRKMTEEEQYAILPNIQVMARASPTDKYTLVKRLLEMDEIVAVTGDGTNDAPALHEASIGLSMGIAGTEVAKESSDIIILDDNFSSIVKVVMWGRSIYVNIQKFIQFQTTVNGVALGINFVSAVASGNAPLTAVQLLWVNLIMDTLGALALATEPPNAALMNRPPVGRSEPLISNIMWRNIVGQAVYQLAMLLVLHFHGFEILDLYHYHPNLPSEENYKHYEQGHKTLVCMIFNAFVFCQIFNEINARKLEKFNIFEGFFNNKLFLYVIVFTIIVQCLIVEFAGDFTSTVHLSWKNWLICVGLGLFSWPLAIIIKLIPVPERSYLSIIMFWRSPEMAGSGKQAGESGGITANQGPSPYPYLREESFLTRLKYAFFPSTIPYIEFPSSPAANIPISIPQVSENNAWGES